MKQLTKQGIHEAADEHDCETDTEAEIVVSKGLRSGILTDFLDDYLCLRDQLNCVDIAARHQPGKKTVDDVLSCYQADR